MNTRNYNQIIFKTFAVLLFFCIILPKAMATQYYVNASQGNDQWSGMVIDGDFLPAGCENNTTLECIDGPWQSLEQATSNLLAGDTVHLKCGETWHETLTVSHSGQEGLPITFTGYGTNCTTTQPIIDAAISPVPLWYQDPDDIYYLAYMGDIEGPITQLFRDGERIPVAREPDLINGVSPYFSITANSVPGSTLTGLNHLLDTNLALPEGVDLTGAEIHIRNQRWRLQDRIVSDYDPGPGQISWQDDLEQGNLVVPCPNPAYESCQIIKKGYGYYLAGQHWMLDQAGEWLHDISSNLLYVKSQPGDHPLMHSWSIPVLDYGIYIKDQNYLIFDGIEIKHSRYDGVYCQDSLNISIKNLTIRNAGASGILMTNWGTEISENHIIENNHIINSTTMGILLGSADNSQLRYNQVENTGNLLYSRPFGELNSGSSGRGVGIRVFTNSTDILDNHIQNSAYSGIGILGMSANNTISWNSIDLSCLLLDDGAGIYMGGNDETDEYHVVSHNLVSNSRGYSFGTPNNKTPANGIHINGKTNSTQIMSNIIYGNAGAGILLHEAYENTLTSNVIYGNDSEISMRSDINPNHTGKLYGNIIETNTMFHLSGSPLLILESQIGDFDSSFDFADFSNNLYASLYSTTPIYENYLGGTVTNRFSFAEWQNRRIQDLDSSIFSDFFVSTQSINKTSGNNMVINPDFSVGLASWGCWFPSKDKNAVPPVNCDQPEIRRQPASSEQCQLEGNCALIHGGSTDQTVFIADNVLDIQQDQSYVLEFLTRSDIPGETGKALVVKDAAGGATKLGMDEPIFSAPFPSFHEHLFVASESYPTSKIDFQVNTAQSMYLDSVRLWNVNVDTNNKLSDSALLVNQSNSALMLHQADIAMGSLLDNESYLDLIGNPVNWGTILQPNEARIVIRAYSPFKDTDGDTVPDLKLNGAIADQCSNTILGEKTNIDGCAYSQLDSDDDGVENGNDCAWWNNTIYPEASEIKHDGIDQDCNGYDLTIDIVTTKIRRSNLYIIATSSYREFADLKVEGLGDMTWKSKKGYWKFRKTIETLPDTITITGVEGSETKILK